MNNMTTITKEQLNIFVVCGKHYVSAQIKDKNTNPLWQAINSLLPGAVSKLKKVERQRELARLNLCKKNSSKHIEYDKSGNYQYTEEDNISLLEKFDAINEETVQMQTHIINDYPTEGLTYDIMQAFEGIVIPEVQREEEQKE